MTEHWRAWLRKPARLPGRRRKITVRGWSIDVLYGSWSWRPHLHTARHGCLSPGVGAVLCLPGKHGIGLSREAEHDAEVPPL